MTQAEVLVQSRRRCCVCFGLQRDLSEKRGQIAHLDKDPANNDERNLAYLCFDHHDQYDSSTSQSKNLRKEEVQRYREELYSFFGEWVMDSAKEGLLNFLAFYVGDLDSKVSAAIKAGSELSRDGELLAFEVLITDDYGACIGENYFPLVSTMARFASWGWLTYVTEERAGESGETDFYVVASRKSVCDLVAERLLERMRTRQDLHEKLVKLARRKCWKGADGDA